MSLTLTLFIAIAILFVILFAVANKSIQDKKQIKKLEEQIICEQEKIGYLMRHIEELARIKKDEKTINDKIEGAKTDEEIADIVTTIILANNERVQNHKAKQ